jgi:hypothetical protein
MYHASVATYINRSACYAHHSLLSLTFVFETGEPVSNHDELMCNFFAQPDALAYGKVSTLLLSDFQLLPKKKIVKYVRADRSRSILAFWNEEGFLSCIYGMSNFFGWWYV